MFEEEEQRWVDKAFGSNSKSNELLKTFVKVSVLILLSHDI